MSQEQLKTETCDFESSQSITKQSFSPEQIKDISDNIIQIPKSIEYYLKSIIVDSAHLLGIYQISEQNEDEIMQRISQFLQLASQQARHQDLPDFKVVNESLNKTAIFIQQKNFVKVLEELKKIIKSIEILDIDQLKKCIKETYASGDLIKNQTVLVLLGGTGAGKSTTIHFLAESKIEKIQIPVGSKFLNHFQAKENKNNPELIRMVKTSPFSKSETRFIYAIPIKVTGMPGITEIFLVDTPGLNDTNGPQIDISNGIGMINALRGCQKVFPVVLINYQMKNNRWSELKQLAKNLICLFTNPSESIEKLHFWFTRFPSTETEDELQASVIDVIDRLTEDQEKDVAFTTFFNEMKSRVQENPVFIDPLISNPQDKKSSQKIISAAIKKKNLNILNPKDQFSFFINYQSQMILKDQLSLFQNRIDKAIKRRNFDLASYLLSRLRFLSELLEMEQNIKKEYSQLLENIVFLFSEKFQKYTRNICLNLKDSEIMNEHLEEYFEGILYFSEASQLISEHLSCKKCVDLEAIQQNMISSLMETVSYIKSEGIRQIPVKKTLIQKIENIIKVNFHIEKKIKEKRDEFNNLLDRVSEKSKKSTEEIINLLQEQIQKIQNEIFKCIELKQFSDLDQKLDLLYNSKEIFKELINGERLKKDIIHINQNLLQFFTKQRKEIEPNLNQDYFSLSDKVEVEKFFKDLEEFTSKLKFDNKDIIDISPINVIRTDIENTLIQKIEEFELKIDNILGESIKDDQLLIKDCDQTLQGNSQIDTQKQLNSQQSKSSIQNQDDKYIFSSIQKFYKQMDLIKQMMPNNQFVEQQNFFLLEKICRLIGEVKRDVTQILSNVKEDTQVNFKILHEGLLKLKSSEWIEEFRKGEFSKVNMNCKALIQERFVFIASQINLSDLNYDNAIEILQYQPQLQELNDMRILKDLYEDLVEEVDNEVKSLNQKIQDLQFFIQSSISEKKFDIFQGAEKMNFCKTLKNFKFFGELKLNLTQMKIENYIKQEGKQDWEKTEDTIKQMMELKVVDQDEIFSYSRFFKDLIEKSEILQKTLDSVYKLYNQDLQSQTYLEQLHDSVQTRYPWIVTEINNTINDNNVEKRKSLFNFLQVFALVGSQNCMSEQIFAKIEQLNKQFQNIAENIMVDTQKALSDQNFQLLSTEIENLKQSKDALESTRKLKSLQTNIVVMIQQIVQLIEDIYNRLQFYSLNQEELSNQIDTLSEQQKYFDQACSYIQQYIPSNMDPIEKNSLFDKIISQKLNNFYIKITQDISNFNIKNFDEQWQKYDYIRTRLPEIAPKYDFKNFEDLNIKKEQEINNLKEFYNTMELTVDNLRKKSPKDYLKQLENAKNYETQISEINETLKFKFRASMPSETENLNRLEEFSRIIRFLTDYLNEDIAQVIIHQSQNVKNLIQDKSKLIDHRLQDIQSTKNWSELDVLYNQNKEKSDIYRINHKIKRIIFNYISELERNADDCLIKDDIQQLLEILESINRVKQTCNGHFKLQIERSIKFASKLEKQIQQILKTLINHFTYQLEIEDDSDSFDDDFDRHSSTSMMTTNFEVQIKDYRKHHDNLLALISFRLNESYGKQITVYYPSFDSSIKNSFKQIEREIIQVTDEFNLIFSDLKAEHMLKLKSLFNYFKTSELFLKELYNILDDHGGSSPYKEDIQVQTFQIIAQDFEIKKYSIQTKEKILQVRNMFDKEQFSLMNQKTKFEKTRNEFYKSVNKNLKILDSSRVLEPIRDMVPLQFKSLYPESVNIFMEKVQEVKQIAQQTLIDDLKSEEICDRFNESFNNLASIIENINCIQKEQQTEVTESIDQVKAQLDTKVEEKLKQLERSEQCEEMAHVLIGLKTINDKIIVAKDSVHQKMDAALKDIKEKKNTQFLKLSQELEKQPIGQMIISEHKCFEGYNIFDFNQRTGIHGIDYVLQNLQGDQLDKSKLKSYWEKFWQEYQKLIDNAALFQLKIDKNEQTNLLVSKIKVHPDARNDPPILLANIFALWTYKHLEIYFQAQQSSHSHQDKFLVTPHPAQVVSIFRILNFQDKCQLVNNLVQIGTGEGKSVTLAVTSAFLALQGHEVSCACYSEYLSKRDYESFQFLFEQLGLIDKIHYGTFNQLCQRMINSKGVIRDLTLDVIIGQKTEDVKSFEEDGKKQKVDLQVLLIDEVDVFFSENFYGKLYRPSASLQDPTIDTLINYIWDNKDTIQYFQDLVSTDQFKNCCERYKGWEFLIQEAAKNMIQDLKDYESQSYFIIDDKIGYLSGDQVDFNIVYGYQTLFANLQEFKDGQISLKSLKENMSINVNCGNISYADIPKGFDNIFGVSGTLKTLSAPELDIVQNHFKINIFTYVPSVFGKNNLHPDQNIKVEAKEDYFNSIQAEIESRLVGGITDVKRCVLVFFEYIEILREFYESETYKLLQSKTQILTQETNAVEQDQIIQYSTISGKITLLTKCFGRGTDFISRDELVINNGGVHVIMTFLPSELAQEVQIRGRTARQGQQGSTSMIIENTQLEMFGILPADYDYRKITVKQSQEIFNKKRNKTFENRYEADKEFNVVVKKENELFLLFLKDLYSVNLPGIQEYLQKVNKGRGLDSPMQISKTLVLMDGTGSMGGLLQKAQNTVGVMFERAIKVLEDSQIDTSCFKIQFAVYRDYDCGLTGVLGHSGWETKPESLYSFMNTVNAQGGGDYQQAIEIGLWHALQMHAKEEISQVILIGDAPAKSPDQISSYRNSYGGQAVWASSQFGPAVHYKTEMAKLKDLQIPVHAFHIGDGCQPNFLEIAQFTSGKCCPLDINSPQGAQDLTNLVTEGILANIGQLSGRGDQLLEKYKSLFSQSVK